MPEHIHEWIPTRTVSDPDLYVCRGCDMLKGRVNGQWVVFRVERGDAPA